MSLMAKLVDVGTIGCYFESLSDPRHTRNRHRLLVDIAVIAVCGILCGCDGPTAIHRWAALQAIGCSSISRYPTASPHATAFAGSYWLLSLKPFSGAFRPGSPTRCRQAT